jgi:hypothetical protein
MTLTVSQKPVHVKVCTNTLTCTGSYRTIGYETEAGDEKSMPTDIVLEKMRQLGIAETRENYLRFAFFGEPGEIDAELEAMLPREFQLQQGELFE